jgi:polysaccharide biosynthesis transport protein
MPSSDSSPFDADPRPETSPVPTGAAEAPPVVTAAPSATTLLKSLRRRCLLAAALGLVGAALAAGLGWLLLPAPPHAVRAQLYVASDQPRVLFQTHENRSDATSFRQTQVALLKSRLVLNAALRQDKVRELSLVQQQADAIAWLEKELRVVSGASPEILTVWMNGDQPGELKTLVDAVIASYLQEIVNKDQIKRQARLDQLKEIAAKYEENLARKRRTMRKLAEEVGTGDKQAIALKQLFSAEQYHAAQKELMQVRSDLRRLETEAAGAGDGDDPDFPESAFAELVQKDPVIARYQALKVRLEENIEETKRKAVQGEKHPAVQRFLQEIVAANRQIDKRRKELRPRTEATLREKMRLDATSHASLLKKRIEFGKRLEQQLTKDVKRLEEEARVLNKGSLDIESYKTDIVQAEEVARKVGEEVEKLTVELQAAPRVNVLEEAVIDSGDGRTRQLRNAALAGVAALLLTLLGVAWWEFHSRRVESVDQVVKGLGMKLVGTLPAHPSWAARRRGSKSGRWQSAFHESINAARAMLLHLTRADGLRVVMVTSAVAGEGKTSLSSQLATSLARSGRKTLLIDADLRNPAAHRLFDALPAPGCCEVLRQEIDAADAIQPTSVPGLSMLPAGHWDDEVLRVLSQDGIEKLFTRLRQDFELIVVDSSPVLPVADAAQMAQHVDGVVFSVLRKVSRLPRVHAAAQRLTQLGVRVLGAVVLGTRVDGDGYGYHYAAAPEPKLSKK